MATIEPWHANQVVVYSFAKGEWQRNVLDESFAGGHAVYWGDFDGDGDEDLIAGHREKSPRSGTVGLYTYENAVEGAWETRAIDEGGMATEDAIVADINGDGKLDIVAGGRVTHNIKYYENLGDTK